MSSIHSLKFIALMVLIAAVASGCTGAPIAAAHGPAATRKASDIDYSMPQKTVEPGSGDEPTGTPQIQPGQPTPTPQPTPTALPANIPVQYARGAIPQAAMMRLGIGGVTAMALSPDRHWFAIGTEAGIYIFDTNGMQQVWEQATHSAVEQIEWSKDSHLVMARLFEWGNVLAWNGATGDLVYRLENENEVATMALSPDGTKLAAGLGSFSLDDPYNSKNAVAIWDVSTGERVVIWAETSAGKGFGAPVQDIDWSPDGTRLAAITGYSTITLFDAATGKDLFTFNQTNQGDSLVQHVAFSPDGSKLVTYTGTSPGDAPGGDDHAYVWDTTSGKLLFSPQNESYVEFAQWSPDGSALLTGSEVGFDTADRPIYDLKIWDVTAEKLLLSPEYHPNSSWARDSQHVLFTQPGALRADWLDIHTGKIETRPTEPPLLPDGASPVALNWVPGGWLETNVNTSAPLALLKSGAVTTSGDWSPDGKFFATVPYAGGQQPVVVWDTETGLPSQIIGENDRLPAWLPSHQIDGDRVSCEGRSPASDPTGKTGIVISSAPSGDADRAPVTTSITVTDLTTGARRFSLIEDHSIPCATAFSADGRYLAIGHKPMGRGVWDIQNTNTDDNFVTVWDVRDGAPVNKYIGHTGSVVQLMWSPDETKLASISMDGTVIIWAVPI